MGLCCGAMLMLEVAYALLWHWLLCPWKNGNERGTLELISLRQQETTGIPVVSICTQISKMVYYLIFATISVTSWGWNSCFLIFPERSTLASLFAFLVGQKGVRIRMRGAAVFGQFSCNLIMLPSFTGIPVMRDETQCLQWNIYVCTGCPPKNIQSVLDVHRNNAKLYRVSTEKTCAGCHLKTCSVKWKKHVICTDCPPKKNANMYRVSTEKHAIYTRCLLKNIQYVHCNCNFLFGT